MGVGVVWVSSFDCAAERLGPEQLSDVRHGTILHGVVREDGDIVVDEQMRVRCSAFIMSWEDSLERHDSVVICALDSSQVSGVPTAFGDVARFVDAGVDAGGVAVPDVDVEGGDAEAGVDV